MLDLALIEETHTDAAALAPPEEGHALRTLALAFENDPPCRWLFPEGQDYRRHFPTFARAFGGAAIARGTALATPDISGVALWLAPGEGPDEDALAALIEVAVPPRRRTDVFAVFDEMGRRHPHESHWYLPLIGVAPAHQGQGRGSQLLRPILARCDADGVHAYLEATTAQSVPLYVRHGFVVLDEIRIGGCPPIVPMLRRPR
jgi:GNAT superfamily N-acetyltransferase